MTLMSVYQINAVVEIMMKMAINAGFLTTAIKTIITVKAISTFNSAFLFVLQVFSYRRRLFDW